MAIPGMEADPDLGFTKTDLGIFLTLNGVVYGVSKFVNGFVGDRVNARWFMMLGLSMCAICNFIFGMSSTVWLFGLMWVLNGWFQGTGWRRRLRTDKCGSQYGKTPFRPRLCHLGKYL